MVQPSDVAALRALYDREVRARPQTDDPAYVHAWDGPVYRLVGPGPAAHDNAVLLSRLTADDADAAIAAQVASFAARGHAFEWKLYEHDAPPDLDRRLAAAGFVAGEPETLVALDVEATALEAPLPPGVTLQELAAPEDFERIVDLNVDVYGDADHARWLAAALAQEKRAAPGALIGYAALAGGQVVSAGWARFPTGSAFGSLWGGATRAPWRGRGVYTALVARRAADARARGVRWLAVDCSPHSLPILLRRGFTRVATTTPWVKAP